MYGFKRIKNGPDKGAYYHELFLRAKPFLANRIDRPKNKGDAANEIEPNLFSFVYLPPTDMSKYQMADGGINTATGKSTTEGGEEKPAAAAAASGAAGRTSSSFDMPSPIVASAPLLSRNTSSTLDGFSFLEENLKRRSLMEGSTSTSLADATKLSAVAFASSLTTSPFQMGSGSPQLSAQTMRGFNALRPSSSVASIAASAASTAAAAQRILYAENQQHVLNAMISPSLVLARRRQAMMAAAGIGGVGINSAGLWDPSVIDSFTRGLLSSTQVDSSFYGGKL